MDITNKLIARSSDVRLGSSGISEIKNHPWFAEIDWNRLVGMQVVPPFKPTSIDEYFDKRYIESYGITDKLKNDVEEAKKTLRNPNVQKQFKGYFYDKEKKETVKKVKQTTASTVKT